MDNVKDIQNKIANLKPEEFSRFRDWFEEYHADLWDKEFAHDVAAGALDGVADDALKSLENGKYTKL